ncbi:acyltransferase family protein [Paenibacillus sepulcri]|uniref:Acyltransferase n=1 Tax=Paenibacillus sepulcri TaxID=359917 RepID=A0ABS7BW50_9BACL|nr:acyltransferase [Paenibacillus sepulcri]
MNTKVITNRIEGLDLLRFGAAFSVLFYHYFFIGPLQGFWPINQFFSLFHFGDFGVDVFFIISGLVISISAEGRRVYQFAVARFIRIMPAFVACSIITAISSSLLPGVAASEIFIRWLASLTFYPQLFGLESISGVYWTLQIELKFYVIVALFLAFRVWSTYKFSVIIPVWLIISLINVFYLHNLFLKDFLITEYTGHFVAGMLLYQIRRGEQNSFTPLGFLLSGILIWNHCVGFESWIGGTFKYSFSDIGTFLIAPICIALVYYVSGIKTVPINSKLLALLGGMSYTLYLLHADFGFFIRAMTDRWLFAKFPGATSIINNQLVVLIAIFSSLILAAVVVIYIEPPLRRALKRVFTPKVPETTVDIR